MAGSGPKCGTAHRNRPFIAGNLSSRNEEYKDNYWSNQEANELEDKEEEKVSKDDISTDEVEDEFSNLRNQQQQ